MARKEEPGDSGSRYVGENYYAEKLAPNGIIVDKPTVTELRLKSTNIPKDIKNLALKNLLTIEDSLGTRSFKQVTQDEVIFACVWRAYHNLGTPPDPKFVIKGLQLEKSKMSVDRAMNNYLSDIRLSPSVFVGFYIDKYMELMGDKFPFKRQDTVRSAMEFIEGCMKPNQDNALTIEWIQSNSLTNACIGMLTFYMTEMIDSQTFSPKLWSKACYLTTVCIKKYKNSFEECFNRCDE